jgi:hypothetical protein
LKTICYIFASRERPEKFFNCLDNIRMKCNSYEYFVIAKLDDDDPYKEQYKICLDIYPEVTVRWGLSKGKIHAINRDIDDLPKCDIVCCHSDDMVFTKDGFDDIIKQHCGPDDFVHFPDQHANERLSTYAIMGREYYDRFGYIYNPLYQSVYADNEQNEVAKLLGKYKYVNEKILCHEHPIWGYGIADDLLKRTEHRTLYQADHQTYLKRKAMNFGL